ncbi:MFS transporter [Actinophytocola sp.]|uniref:MFS transporter n=1 Tax=Actinophytocola sp. TaxID=1872138 RepID=UPI002D603CD9|nr:MFS transporter [Actinophytocola sp.]HYQ63929.1 MFS transporter [Actinophytocola sp.]
MADQRVPKAGILVLLCVSQFIIALDFSILNVALPTVQEHLGFSRTGLPWVISAYALAFGGLLILGGRVADLFGRRRVLVVGVGLFAVASLACGLADSPEQLVSWRGVQGVGAAATAPAAFSLLTTTFVAPSERERALGAWSAVLGAGFVLGVLGGGLITGLVGWRWVFFINVPIAVAVVAAAVVLVPVDGRRPGGRRLDLGGAVLVTTGLVVLIYGCSQVGSTGVPAILVVVALLAGLALLTLFALVQRRSVVPLVPPRFWRTPGTIRANSANLLLMAAFSGMVFLLTLFLQQRHHLSPTATGLVFAPSGVAGLAGGVVGGLLAKRTAPGRLLPVSAFVQFVATAVLVLLPEHGTVLIVVAATIVTNFSGVVAIVMISVMAAADVPPADQGLAGGLLNTTQQIGGALGLAVVTAAVTLAGNAVADATDALRWGMAAAAGLCLLGAVAGWIRPRVVARVPEFT